MDKLIFNSGDIVRFLPAVPRLGGCIGVVAGTAMGDGVVVKITVPHVDGGAVLTFRATAGDLELIAKQNDERD